MTVIVSNAGASGGLSSLPNTVSGTGTTPKVFGPILNLPGSLRLDGAETIIRASGNVNCGVSSQTQLVVLANYPTLATGSAQYPTANITNAVGNVASANIALYNAVNNFVIGQYVTVANIANTNLNGTVGPLVAANSTAFAGQVNGANVATAAAANQVATGTIAPIPIYTQANTAALNVGAALPWQIELHCSGDQQSGLMITYGTDQYVNFNASAVGASYFPIQSNTTAQIINPALTFNTVPGVNFRNEPPLYLTVAETFQTSNANNNATLKNFFVES